MGTVYFTRHGQTVWNVENKICGATDSPLTVLGHEQAIELGKKILEEGIQIDEILDKSELFDATEDKSSAYTNDKIVQLKPVKQHLPVGKYISVAAAIAAIVIFVISVKNYQTVGRGARQVSCR